ncbi:M20 family metallopeptidase [Peribacillus huizhouensis]|uniref:Succinyl-diaminopimelate desuccinylase n=1 Tax=Peribacillus huizhouensis TaxID=1501239 RepID=A0ABR6CMW2_9BACI|nr:M20 family metallopeptidase [Peribacillus huizhouensis]MBA9026350.1 succinyl-diaminopimelate desuccinylase [Peribacillus huizhouensis]
MELENVFKQIDEDDAILFLQSLIQINTINPPGMEKALADLISLRLSESGLLIHSDVVEEDRENLIVSYSSEDQLTNNSKTLIYSGHFDTVPVGNVEWNFPVFEGKQVENRIFGRGSSDMKSGVAAMILAIECIQKAGIKLSGNLQFIGTVGEEVNCIGAREVVKKGQIDQATAIVISEPTSNQVVVAHKGALWLEISMFGKTAHGSMPSHGINAILAINHFINKLNNYDLRYERHDILGDSTLNIGMIQGGVGPNVVPDQCKITIDIRTVPGQNHQEIIGEINELLQKVSEEMNVSYKIDVINNLVSVYTAPDHPFIHLALDKAQSYLQNDPNIGGVNYYTDGSIYRNHLQNVPILICGPGEPTVAHQPDEWVDIQKYLDSIRFYISLAINYLK